MTALYTPKNLSKWTLPRDYCGAQWPDYYAFLGRNRDSDHLTNSNFEKGLEAIREVMSKDSVDSDDSASVQVVCENHWACGWIEWIAIHESDSAALEKADEIAAALENYPVLDEEDFSNREYEDYQESWKDYGASDFVRQLAQVFKLKDTTKYFLDEMEQSQLMEFYESLISSGEYYIGESSGVALNVEYAVKLCSRDQLATFIKEHRP